MDHNASHDIIIIGRNIAGLGAAYALGMAGYSVLIIGPETRLYGGFQLAPNGFSAMETLGLRQGIDAGALTVNAIQLKSLERAETLAEISHDDTQMTQEMVQKLEKVLRNIIDYARFKFPDTLPPVSH